MHHHGGPSNLVNINDPCNGLLLDSSLHVLFRCGEVAFLRVITCVVTIQGFIADVMSKCIVLLNWKHGRSGKNRVLASALALCLTTYYHMSEYFR